MATRKGLGDKKNRHDPAYLRAKRDNYAGRAVYKLDDIDKRFHLIKTGAQILDLGCWPGSWLQYAAQKAGPEARLVGIDLDEVEISLPLQVPIKSEAMTIRLKSADDREKLETRLTGVKL